MNKKPSSNEYLLKIVPVGISSIINCKIARTLTRDKFSINYTHFHSFGQDTVTTRIENAIQPVKAIFVIPNVDVVFDTLRRNYYRGTSAAYFYFHKGFRKTFTAILDLIKEFTDQVPSVIPYTLVGYLSNSKKSEEVTTQEGEELAEQLGVRYYEFSLDDHIATMKVFRYLVNKVIG